MQSKCYGFDSRLKPPHKHFGSDVWVRAASAGGLSKRHSRYSWLMAADTRLCEFLGRNEAELASEGVTSAPRVCGSCVGVGAAKSLFLLEVETHVAMKQNGSF